MSSLVRRIQLAPVRTANGKKGVKMGVKLGVHSKTCRHDVA